MTLEHNDKVVWLALMAISFLVGAIVSLLFSISLEHDPPSYPPHPLEQGVLINPQAGIGPWGVLGGIKKEPC